MPQQDPGGDAEPGRAAEADPAALRATEPGPATEPELGPAAQAVEASRPARAPAGELTSVICALLLLGLMFAVKWFGVVALPRSADRSGIQTAATAWTELSAVRWLMLLTVVITLGSVAIHITQRSHGSQTDTSLLVTAAGTLTAGLLFYRVMVALPSPGSVVDAKLGAFVGLLAAVGVALGGFESVLDQRRRRRRRRVQARSRRRGPLATEPRAR
jgi:hypothetical protein